MELQGEELQRYYYEGNTYGRKYKSQLNKLMLKSLEDTPFIIKIADLGYARQLKVDGYAESFLGTPQQEAPELFKKIYNHKIDVWGIANIYYTVLTGKLLFGGAYKDYTKQLEQGTWSIPFKVPISLEGIKFLNQLLVYDPDKRISITELVEHPYLKLSKEKLIPI
jgi:serine/threonine protein kinase